MTTDKSSLRERIWTELSESEASRFPGAKGRIPNFVGAEAAAEQLCGWEVWQRAKVLKCNPDSPQRPVRHAALKAGKTVYMAVPKLASDTPFVELDPEVLGEDNLWRASSIKGADELGTQVAVEDVKRIDLIVTGCVGVTSEGARLGKGGGYSDLEYALLRELDLVDADTPICSTVHPIQVCEDGAIPMSAHDISLDLYATPDERVDCPRPFDRPPGVLDGILPDSKRAEIPVLAERDG